MDTKNIFPVDAKKKTPLTHNGFKDASSSADVHKKWEKLFPNCGWGYPTGNGIFVIDVDKKSGGLESWDQLTRNHGFVDTYTVKTQSGGMHIYLSMPSGTSVRNSASKFAEGIDIRGEGGYVVIPPTNGYEVINDADVIYPPLWILERLNIGFPKTIGSRTGFQLPKIIRDGERNATLYAYGCSLRARSKPEEEIRKLLEDANENNCVVALEEEELEKIFSQVLLRKEGLSGFSAKTDGVAEAKRNAVPEDYRQAMIAMGYSFKLNLIDNGIYVNGHSITDIDEQELLFNLGNKNFSSRDRAVQAYSYEAKQHEFHPVQDYLLSLKWDGQDHISKLAGYFEDEEGVFGTWLRKWLIGSVAKVLPKPVGVQNRTLVLAGNQNAGKSFFVRWLASDVPEHHLEKSINPEDKDDQIRKMSSWIWEVAELGSTTRKADIEALKNFQSAETVTVRKSYGRHDLHKPALANFIATVNNEGTGFLNDPTGNRRYMACTIKNIDWRYSQEVDVKQVWAQAVALFDIGEDWNLSDEEANKANSVNDKYEVDNTVGQYVFRFFDIDPTDVESQMPTSEIIDVLRKNGSVASSDRMVQMDISRCLTRAGLIKKKIKPIGYSDRVATWLGIKPKLDVDPPNMARDVKRVPHNSGSSDDAL